MSPFACHWRGESNEDRQNQTIFDMSDYLRMNAIYEELAAVRDQMVDYVIH